MNDKPVTQDEFLTKREAAIALRVCSKTLENLVRRGELKVSKIGKQIWRVKLSELTALMDRTASTK
jgi:excisionase family DNA binding protein